MCTTNRAVAVARRIALQMQAAAMLCAFVCAAPVMAKWHLPFVHGHKKKPAHRKLAGQVSKTSIVSPFDAALSQAVAAAERNNAEYRRYAAAAAKFSTRRRKITARLADTLNYTLMYRGVSQSSEAGDVILGKNGNKVKSYACARYLQQKIADDLTLKVTTLALELAQESGQSSSSAPAAHAAYTKLAKLAGPTAANKLWQSLVTSSTTAGAPAPSGQLSVSQMQTMTRTITSVAASKDPITNEIKSDLDHFGRHHKGVEGTHKTVRVALSAASLVPSVVGPAAQATLFGYLAMTGGPEDAKLLKELYLDKRLSNRARLLSEEAHLALESYNLGVLTNNQKLSAASKQMIAHLTDQQTASRLLATTGGCM